MFCLHNTSNLIHLLSFAAKESNKENLFCFFYFFVMQCPMQLQRRLQLLKYFRRRLTLRRLMRLAPQRTRCARLRRRGSLRLPLLLGNFLPSLTSLTLVTTADLAGLTALYFLILLFSTSYNVFYIMLQK